MLTLGAVIAFGGWLATPAQTEAQARCPAAPLMVQVLGSGGPLAGDARASTGYLIWRDGRAVMMIDAGGGTFARFGEAGARLQDLSLLAISHLHPDHVADLPALLWLSETARQHPLRIAGPSGAGAFPSFEEFLARMFDGSRGAFPILAGTLGQNGQGVRLEPLVIDATTGTPITVWSDDGIEVRALGVPHGNVPSIAYRVQAGDRSIVFGSDQNGSDARFARFAAGADLLVLHLAIGQRAPEPLARLHARPAVVGQMARAANARRVLLSHVMQGPPTTTTPEWFSLFDVEQAVAEIRGAYSGPLEVASDLQCVPIR